MCMTYQSPTSKDSQELDPACADLYHIKLPQEMKPVPNRSNKGGRQLASIRQKSRLIMTIGYREGIVQKYEVCLFNFIIFTFHRIPVVDKPNR